MNRDEGKRSDRKTEKQKERAAADKKRWLEATDIRNGIERGRKGWLRQKTVSRVTGK